MQLINWSEGDIARRKVIDLLLKDCPKIIDWMFVNGKPEMFGGPEVIKERSKAYSSGEQILIRIACEIWFNDPGDVFDICRRLDSKNFLNVILAMDEFRKL